MYRYLFNLSYIGTPFRGTQRQLRNGDDHITVQGVMEFALKAFKPVNNIQVATSSRTDAGVHALHTTMHTDLERQNGEQYHTVNLTFQLNKYFLKENIPIRILSTYQVPAEFHCRHAISRIYLYRLVVVNGDKHPLACHIPIEDLKRAFYKSSTTFDFARFKSAMKLFMGLHDFRTFMARESFQAEKMTRRKITRFEAFESDGRLYSPFSLPDAWMKQPADSYRHIDVVIESSGFLYRQVNFN